MNKKIIVLILAGLLTTIFLLMVVTGSRKENRSGVAEKKSLKSDSPDLIIQGKQYEKEGRYLEAKAAYWKAVEESFDNEIIREAEKRLYRLNMKVLFSPIMTEDSQKYIVVKRDTLSKIAKKFGTTVELLMRSNQLTSDRIKPDMELKVSRAKYSIVIDRSQNLLILKSNNDEVLKIYQVSTGKNESTPLGNFEVTNKLVDPTWYSAGAVVPSGSPENILGSRWIGISRSGYGIHGTTEPETVGRHITAGCIRMSNEDVEELYAIIPVGIEVTIVD